MAKTFVPQVMTANDLVEGDSVFLSRSGWTRDIAAARVALNADEAELLARDGALGEVENKVVGPYSIDVTVEEGRPVPVLRRERIRADGAPTFAYAPAEARAA